MGTGSAVIDGSSTKGKYVDVKTSKSGASSSPPASATASLGEFTGGET